MRKVFNVKQLRRVAAFGLWERAVCLPLVNRNEGGLVMREIVFRGKRTDNGEWVAGDFCRPCSICFEASGEDGETEWYDCAVAPETVGQYIGLTDRNGTPIFEGDVVRHRRELWGRDASLIGAVCRDDALCRFCLLGEHGRVPLSANAAARYEVIGNVHGVKPAACAEQLAALNDRLMDRARYEALGEDVDAVVASLQHWLIEYENCHPRSTANAI